MDVSIFKSPPVEAVYERGGQVLKMSLDADILTADFLSEMELLARGAGGDTFSEQAAQVSYFCAVLSRTVKRWDLKDGKKAIQPTEAFFRTLPLEALSDLFAFVIEEATGAKKKTVSPTALESVDGFSRVGDSPPALQSTTTN